MDKEKQELQSILVQIVGAVKKGMQKLCSEPDGELEIRPADLTLPKSPNSQNISTVLVLSPYQFWDDPIFMLVIRYDDEEFSDLPDEYKDPVNLSNLEFFGSKTEFSSMKYYKLGIENWEVFRKQNLSEGVEDFQSKTFGIKGHPLFKIDIFWKSEFDDIWFAKSLLQANNYPVSIEQGSLLGDSFLNVSNVPQAPAGSFFNASAIVAESYEDLTKLDDIQDKLQNKSFAMMQQQFGNFGKKKNKQPQELLAECGNSIYEVQARIGFNSALDMEDVIELAVTQQFEEKHLEVSAMVGNKSFRVYESIVQEEEYYHQQEDEVESLKSTLLNQCTEEQADELMNLKITEYQDDIVMGKQSDYEPGKLFAYFEAIPNYGGQTKIEEII